MDPMAERLGIDAQRLQQFLSDSTWDYEPVRENLTRWALERITPRAIVIDDVGFPKDGPDSPGVARMYSGTLGKTGNCQIGVSAHLVTDHASSAVNWRLFIPESWDPDKIDDPVQAETVRKRRDRCKIPLDVGHREKWRLALAMLDQMCDEWGVGADLPVIFDKNIPRGADGSLPERLLLVEWPPGEPEPTDYWITNLPADTPLRDLARLAKIRWRIEYY